MGTPLTSGGGSASADPNYNAEQQSNVDIRVALSDAYSAVQSDAGTQSFSTYTFEDALQDQIDAISGTTNNQNRPNLMDEVTAIVTNLTQAISAMATLPPTFFAMADPDLDVNTPASAEDEDSSDTSDEEDYYTDDTDDQGP